MTDRGVVCAEPPPGGTVIELRWNPDIAGHYLVPINRVPCVGEKITGPDDMGTLVVTKVRFAYESGFYYPPSRVIVEVERDD